LLCTVHFSIAHGAAKVVEGIRSHLAAFSTSTPKHR
jgi:hypothetical protein